MSREEELLRGLIDGTSVDAEPQSRSEAYLKAMIDGDDVSELGEPQSRIEELYSELADVIEGGGGGGGSHTLITPLSVEENGTYTAPEGTAYSPVTVNVPTGGGGPKVEEKDVNFYDYDGTVLYSYTKDEFLALDTMPDNPDRTDEGLTAQGWNWTYTEARECVQKYGYVYVGQLYNTTDTKTHIYITIDDDLIPSRKKMRLAWTQSAANGVVVDWGDGSPTESFSGTSLASHEHTYATGGDYHIVLDVVTGTISYSGSSTSSIIGSTSDVYIKRCIRKIHIGSKGFIDYSTIGDYAFANCVMLQSITIPKTVYSINDHAFYICSELKAFVVPQGINNIDSYTFGSCRSLRTVIMPGSTNQSFVLYASQLFMGSNNVERLNPIGIYARDGTVGNQAFATLQLIKKLYIGPKITEISQSAFQLLASLQELHFCGETPPTLANANAFQSLPTDCKIYVPTGTLSAYTSATRYPSSSTYTYIEE